MTSPGPGRIDAFGNVRRLLFQGGTQGFTQLAGQLSPPLGCQATRVVPLGRQHQLAHGAEYWPGNGARGNRRSEDRCIDNLAFKYTRIGKTFRSRYPPRMAQRTVRPVDTTSEKYGEAPTLYLQHCANCHDRQEGGQKHPDGGITYAVKEIGTDRHRATNFAEPLEDQKPFTEGLQQSRQRSKSMPSRRIQASTEDDLDLPDRQDPLAGDFRLRCTAAGGSLGQPSVPA